VWGGGRGGCVRGGGKGGMREELLDSGYLREVHVLFIHGTCTLMPEMVQVSRKWCVGWRKRGVCWGEDIRVNGRYCVHLRHGMLPPPSFTLSHHLMVWPFSTCRLCPTGLMMRVCAPPCCCQHHLPGQQQLQLLLLQLLVPARATMWLWR
jgi:hypothetical protein